MIPVRELVLPTQDEILERFKSRLQGDPFGFEIGEYISFMDYAHAKPYIKDGLSEGEWECSRFKHTTPELLKTMKEYQEFAWNKANECRGISASRSIMHFIAWTWLLGDADFSDDINREFLDDYKFYGKPILIRVAERYGWDWKQFDNGKRQNQEEE